MAGRIVPDAFRVHLPIEPEQLVFDSYTLLPHHRTGIAAALRHPFSPAAPATAKVTLRVPVIAGAGTDNAEVTLHLRGPGAVASLIGKQVIRRYPEPGTADAEPSDLAHIEFDAPDLPWQFTPAGPDAGGHLPPWLRLVVVDAAVSKIVTTSSGGLPVLTTPRSELPPTGDAWAWAHAQVIGKIAAPQSIAQRLAPATPLANLSRLIAPRQLPAFRNWIACVVPTFKVGAQAGIGNEPTEQTLAYAWGDGAGGVVTLPVYDHWTFSTGPNGDFETLAERLWPVMATGSVGERRVDVTHPGNGIPPVPADVEGADRRVRGALTRPNAPGSDGKHWPTGTTDHLRHQVEAAAEHKFGTPAGTDPAVGPPIYAGAHTARSRVPDAPAAWFRDLNLDPADRIVAGLGTRVVQMDQESLMASAWSQVAGVEDANRALRLAQFARYTAESLHRRHLAGLDAANLLAVTQRVSSRVLAEPGMTLSARIAASVLPTGAVAGTLRRLAAPRGKTTRFVRAPDGELPAISRARAVRHLVTDDDGNARSWVRTYADPDGVTDLHPIGLELLPPGFGDVVAAGLAEPALPDALTNAADDGSLSDLFEGDPPDIARDVVATMLDASLAALPTRAEIERDRGAAASVGDILRQLMAVLDVGRRFGQSDWIVQSSTAARTGIGRPIDDGLAIVTDNEVEAYARAVAEWAREAGFPVEVAADPAVIDVLLVAIRHSEPRGLADDYRLLSDGLTRPGGLRDIDRSSFSVDSLDLLGKLDPKETLTRRVLARLPDPNLWPPWLPRDWFGDKRIEQILAAPRFNHPMYEALDRYDREWLMPGVGAMKPHEMVTLLQTNSRFAEAFLVGANTEFARELVWRGYPTDGRATSFYSFWTPAAELVAPVHALDNQSLGAHIDEKFAGALVLLVRGELIRRYPNVLAHAVKQTADEDPPTVFAKVPAKSLFRLHLEPDLLLVGFDLKGTDVAAPPPGTTGAYWFTLSEHIGEPRFGLDEVDEPAAKHPDGAVVKRDDLQWGDLRQDANGILLTTTPRVKIDVSGGYRPDAAFLAWLLFQQPSRAAFAATDIMDKVR